MALNCVSKPPTPMFWKSQLGLITDWCGVLLKIFQIHSSLFVSLVIVSISRYSVVVGKETNSRIDRQSKNTFKIETYPFDFPVRFTDDPSPLSKTIEVLGKHWPNCDLLDFISIPERIALISAASNTK